MLYKKTLGLLFEEGSLQVETSWSGMNHRIDALLKAFKLTEYPTYNCVYFSDHKGTHLLIMLFVENGLMASNNPAQMDLVLKFMKDVFITKVTMNPELYVGVHIERDHPHRIIYINTLLQKFKFQDNRPLSTCVEPSAHLHIVNNTTDESLETTCPYAQLIGSSQFVALTTRPHIAFSINNVAQI